MVSKRKLSNELYLLCLIVCLSVCSWLGVDIFITNSYKVYITEADVIGVVRAVDG